MSSKEYEPLRPDGFDSSQEDLLRYDEHQIWVSHKSALSRARKAVYALATVLVFASLSNVVLFMKLKHLRGYLDARSFVGLEKNIPTVIPHRDESLDDPMWDLPKYDLYAGWVALDNDYAEAKGAPTSMHWPWDDSKSIYVFHSYHSLHCVYVLRESLMQFRDGAKQTWAIGHVTHCLHVLREDVICDADDTPRYTGHLHAQENSTMLFSGTGQTRMCRNWDKLREWSMEHSACYKRSTDHYVPLLDRYKNCPDGSTPWAQKGN